MQSLWQDLRYGMRMLLRSPGFATAATLTLALGIGINAAIFSAVYGLLFSSLPYADPDRLIQIWDANPQRGWDDVSISYPNFLDWQSRHRTFEGLALYQNAAFNLTGRENPERIQGARVSANLLPLLGREPLAGRHFLADEDKPGAEPVVILSHRLWQRNFAGNSELIGSTISVDGLPCTVVGIMPAGFYFPSEQSDLWLPHGLDAAQAPRGSRSFAAIGRLKAGVSLDQARQDLGAIATHLEQEYPDANWGWGVNLIPRREEIFDRDLGIILTMIYLAVGFVLLIACANVANLLLARAASREREMAIRTALGGGRIRLLRQLLTESVLLAVLGGLGGILVAFFSIPALMSLAPADTPHLDRVGLDQTVLLYMAGVTLMTGILFGLAPALQITRAGHGEGLRAGERGGMGRRRQRSLKALVVTEVALALMLLICGGLMARSFMEQVRIHPGFESKNLLTLRTTLPESRYGEGVLQAAFFNRALERMVALPGVESAAAVQTLPLDGNNSWRGIDIEGHPVIDPGDRISVGYLVVTPDYFRTMGIPLLLGRALRQQDGADAPPVVVVNQTMARRYWPDDPNPVGRRVRFSHPDASWITVIGVAADVRHSGLGRPARPELYVPHAQHPARSMTFVARTTPAPSSLAAPLREAFRAVDRDQPLYAVRTMERVLDERMAGPRATAQVMGVLAGLALALALVGIYGVVAYAVTRRTQEIGIRMALGARQRDVLRLIVGEGMLLVALGLLIGLLGAAGTMRFVESVLFGITPTDPLTYGVLSLFLLGVALLAGYFPARRAARVNPVTALRHE